MLMGDVVRTNASRTPHDIALVDGSVRLPWHELERSTNQFANALSQLGVARGERVALLARNCHEWLTIWVGAAKAGALFVPLTKTMRMDEVVWTVNHCEAAVLVVGEHFISMVKAALPQLTHVRLHIGLGSDSESGVLSYRDVLSGQSVEEPSSRPSENDPVRVVYSTGSTGRPKGIILTHRQVVHSALVTALGMRHRDDDIRLIYGPMSHNGGMGPALSTWIVGGRIVLHDGFDAQRALEDIEREGVTTFTGFPSVLQALGAHPDFGRFSKSSLRTISIAGTAMAHRNFEEAMKLFPGVEFQHSYGATEGGGLSTVNFCGDATVPITSVGKPLPGIEIRICDERGIPQPAGAVGEICLKTDSVMAGYYRDPDETERALRNGWLHTGDLGSMDQSGHFYVSGRLKDIVKSGGESISPLEVEEILQQHPWVREVAVLGVPDDKWGEAVVAVIVPVPGHSLSYGDLARFCDASLSSFKRPKRVYLVDSLPRSAALDKVLRGELRQQIVSGALDADRLLSP